MALTGAWAQDNQEDINRQRALPYNRYVYQFDLDTEISNQQDIKTVLQNLIAECKKMDNKFVPRIPEGSFEVGQNQDDAIK